MLLGMHHESWQRDLHAVGPYSDKPFLLYPTKTTMYSIQLTKRPADFQYLGIRQSCSRKSTEHSMLRDESHQDGIPKISPVNLMKRFRRETEFQPSLQPQLWYPNHDSQANCFEDRNVLQEKYCFYSGLLDLLSRSMCASVCRSFGTWYPWGRDHRIPLQKHPGGDRQRLGLWRHCAYAGVYS